MSFKNQLKFDPAGLEAEQDVVGTYLKAADGTLLTHTGGALNVNVANTVTVQATDLDIRNLDHAQDDVAIAQGGNTMVVNADGSINVNADISVTNGSDKAEDAAHASGDIGTFVLAVRNDGGATSLTSADGDYSPVAVDEFGRIFSVTSLTAEKAEDAAHSSGDSGIFTLAVAQAALAASVSADGDYGAFKLNARGALWTAPVGTVADDAADTENPVKVGSRARIGALTAISADGDRADLLSDKYRRLYVADVANIGISTAAITANTTAANVVASLLAGRKRLIVENVGGKACFLGNASVTAANGFELGRGSVVEWELGENVDLYAITQSGTCDLRIVQLA